MVDIFRKGTFLANQTSVERDSSTPGSGDGGGLTHGRLVGQELDRGFLEGTSSAARRGTTKIAQNTRPRTGKILAMLRPFPIQNPIAPLSAWILRIARPMARALRSGCMSASVDRGLMSVERVMRNIRRRSNGAVAVRDTVFFFGGGKAG